MNKIKKFFSSLLAVFIVFTFIVVIILAAYNYVINFGTTISDKHEDWAQFGDFWGGFLGGISIIAIIYTLVIQQKQLKLQQKELKEQRDQQKLDSYERMVFWLIDSNQKILNEIYSSTSTPKWNPMKAINAMQGLPHNESPPKQLLDTIYDSLLEIGTLDQAVFYIHKTKFHLINTYCRNLFNTLKTIEDRFPIEHIHNIDEIKKYTDLLRSLIPEKMIYIIAIVITKTKEQDNNTFRQLIFKYSMLQNIYFESLNSIIPSYKDYLCHAKNYEENNLKCNKLKNTISRWKNILEKQNKIEDAKKHRFDEFKEKAIEEKWRISTDIISHFLYSEGDIQSVMKYIEPMVPNQSIIIEKDLVLLYEYYNQYNRAYSRKLLFKQKIDDNMKKMVNIESNNYKIKELQEKLESSIEVQLIKNLGIEFFKINDSYKSIKENLKEFRIDFPEIKFQGVIQDEDSNKS